MSTWSGQPKVEGSSETMRMFLLTCVSIGITFTWGVEMTYCSPRLYSISSLTRIVKRTNILGLGRGTIIWVDSTAHYWSLADESTSKWGRRRPIIVIGSFIVAGSLLVLGFTKEIVGFFVSDKATSEVLTIVLAVLSLYSVDFSINAVMSCGRSLVVDTLPISKQQTGAAWASRMGSLGHIIGYAMGAIDLVSIFGTTLGDTQFKQLTVIAALGMLATAFITCWAVTERVLVSVRHDPRQAKGSFKVVRQIYATVLTLPPRIQAICNAVFWSWIGWFPFIVYSSTWVGETYFRYDVSADARNSDDALGDMGRIGSTALTVYSTVSFIAAWVLPALIQAPEDKSFTHRPPASIAPLVTTFNKYKPDLLTAWIAGNIMFAGAMFITPFATSFRFATAIVALCGIPWSVAGWAPTTFLGIEVNKLSGQPDPTRNIEMRDVSVLEMGKPDEDSNTSSSGGLSGVYFGILNIYVTIPQFLSTLMSGAVFAMLEPGKSPELAHEAHPSETADPTGPNAIAVTMFLGALGSLVAAVVTKKLRYV